MHDVRLYAQYFSLNSLIDKRVEILFHYKPNISEARSTYQWYEGTISGFQTEFILWEKYEDKSCLDQSMVTDDILEMSQESSP
jgi:hypothetical protein